MTRYDESERSWFFSPSGFLLFVAGNYASLSRVPELRGVVDAYDRLQEGIAMRNKRHPAAYKNQADYYVDITNDGARVWTQMKLALGEPAPR